MPSPSSRQPARRLRVLLSSAEPHLAVIEQALLVLESSRGDERSLDALVRCARSLRRSASALGLEAVAALAASLAEAGWRVRAGTGRVTPRLLLLLRQATDALRERLLAAARGERDLTADHALLLERIVAAQGRRPPSGRADRPGRRQGRRP